MAKEVEKLLGSSSKGASFVVHLHGDKKASAERRKEVAKANRLTKVALTTNPGGTKSPPGYKLNDEVKFTILLYLKKKVVENFALNKLDETIRKKIVQAAGKLMGVETAAK